MPSALARADFPPTALAARSTAPRLDWVFMSANHAGFSCGLQVFPVSRRSGLQARLASVETIHQKIKRLRTKKGMTLEQFAEAVGVKYQSAQQWERSDETATAPRRTRIRQVARVLGVSEAYLLASSVDEEERAPIDPLADRLVRAFFWLTDEQKAQQLGIIEAMAVANKAIAKEITGRVMPVPDEYVARHLRHPRELKRDAAPRKKS